MRLPVVMTVANRAISAPINIWNDQSDAMVVRDSGWIMLFSENIQETVEQHLLAYKVAEKLSLPVMVNLDGFILTHTFEPVEIPDGKIIKKFLPDYKPKKGEYLDPANPVTLGALATPDHYMEIREDLSKDILNSKKTLEEENSKLSRLLKSASPAARPGYIAPGSFIGNPFIEYYGPKNPKIILVALGSVIGTIKEVADELNEKKFTLGPKVGVLKIKCYRPFPQKEIREICKSAKQIAVLDKSISLGHVGPLASEIRSSLYKEKCDIKSFIVGLGGRDVTREMIKNIINNFQKFEIDEPSFVG